MEDSVRADALTLSPAADGAAEASGPNDAAATGWLHSPAFDLLLLANVGWLVFLLPGFASSDGDTPVSFWQMYFLTTPHRWLTLGLVAVDPDRRAGRGWLFLALALFFLAVVAVVRISSNVFLCLFLVDYVWNAWHFGAQHAGVLRMYSRKAHADRFPALERHGLRAFVFYTILRTAAWSTGWLEEASAGVPWLHRLDLVMLVLPAALLWNAGLPRWSHAPRLAFLWSVCLLYSILLLALRAHHMPLILSLTVAAALFHAVEYLAVVTLYAQRRQAVGSAGTFRTLARRWVVTLALLMMGLGVMALVAERWLSELWMGINLWAAFLHYAYDGMIWKLRLTETARALGV